MTRVIVNGERKRMERNDGSVQEWYVGAYFYPSVDDHTAVYLEGDWGFEVIPPAHRGKYDPNHWVELDHGWDALLRHGRHRLDTEAN